MLEGPKLHPSGKKRCSNSRSDSAMTVKLVFCNNNITYVFGTNGL